MSERIPCKHVLHVLTDLLIIATGVTLPASNFVSKLPDELLVKIFSKLSTSDLLNNVVLVSKQFCRLAQSPEVHLYVELQLNSSVRYKFDFEVESFLRQSIHLRRLSIKTPFKIPNVISGNCLDSFFVATKDHKNLKSIFVDPSFYITSHCFAWFEWTSWLKNLSRLEVRVVRGPSYEDSIRKLCPRVNVEDIVRFGKILESSDNLKHFSIKEFHSKRLMYFDSNRVSDPNYFKNLSSVTLSSEHPVETILDSRKNFLEDLTILGMKNYVSAIAECVNLKSLDLTFSGRQGLNNDLFKTLKNLTTLKLNMNCQAHHFSANSLPHLKQLDFTGRK